jgi:NADH-quinone oxidoreductase subunit L
VLAYSTISQLGFMFVALGVGAYSVAIFQIYTHAFSGLPVPGAGSADPRARRRADIPKWGARAPDSRHLRDAAVATAAIAGIPPLAGFFSKDDFLVCLASSRGGSPPLSPPPVTALAFSCSGYCG